MTRPHQIGVPARLVQTFACCLLLSGCVLPYEQLALPGKIDPAVKPQFAATTRKGIPLGSGGDDETTTKRVYMGSGEYAAGKRTRTAETNPTWAAEGPVGRTTPAGGRETADGVSLNLVGASVAEAAKTVLGDVLGVNYVVSDKLKNTVTLRTVRPVDKAGLLEIFESVLRVEGAALVVQNGVYKVLPASDAAAGGAPLRVSKSGNGRRVVAGLGTDIAPLRFVSAVEMERILKSAAPQAGVLRVDSARNLLVLSGSSSELASMREMIEVFDVDSMKGMSFGLYPIDTADPDAIAQELDTIFANDRDGPTKGIVRFVGNRRLKSVLVISARPEYMTKAATWISRLDKTSQATEKRVHVYHVQHRPVSEVAILLQKVYTTRVNTSQTSGSQLPGAQSSAGTTLAGNPGSPGTTGTSPVAVPNIAAPTVTAPAQPGQTAATPLTEGSRQAVQTPVAPTTASSAAEAITTASIDSAKSGPGSGLPPDDRASGISIVADEPNNSLVITATTEEYKRIRRILEKVDTTPIQVMLEATIAEVTLNDELKFGVRWFFHKGSNDISFTDASGTVAAPFTGFAYFFNSFNIKAVLNALSTITDVNVVSSPTLMVVENKKAVLQVGDEVPILTQSAVSPVAVGGGVAAPIVNSVTYRNTGVILGITPRVGNDGRVLLEIEQEVSDVVANTVSSIASPTIQQRRVKTTVSVKDGESIILAGLMQDKASRVRDQVPLFGNIPLLGLAFKNKTDTISRTELMIAITPQVIRDDSQVAAVTAEFRDRINFSTRPQRRAPPDHKELFDRIIR